MPPKGKEVKGGKRAVLGNFKAGKLLKDILPPNSKPPREGLIVKQEGEPSIHRQFEYEPLPHFPEWPGNEEARQHDFSCRKDANDQEILFEDNFQYYLPPSFKEFMRGENIWLRPEQYIREIIHEIETEKLRAEKRKQSKTRKAIRKAEMMSLTGQAPPVISSDQQALMDKDFPQGISRDAIKVYPCVIASIQRLESDEELKKRKEEEEKKADNQKGAKKKAAPAKGAPVVVDPMDSPQLLSIPIENSLDLGFSMPAYTKWATSQFQMTKDRSMRDVVTQEKIWERIYPQQNGAPVVSASGKYWVKVRFMGKERLVEIDDRIPCDTRSKPLFARTQNPQELWPQLLMKALLKVYSYKWYSENAQFEKEIGDGSIIYSLTGLIPEYVSLKDFEKDGLGTFREMLQDEVYFGHKAYLSVYCGEEFRPRLPSQLTAVKKMEVQNKEEMDEYSEYTMSPGYDTSSKMLNKLKQSASMAITVTTGRKLNINKNPNASNIIPGFGYAVMDMFENEFVDMDSIVKVKDQIAEEKASPFKSPEKRPTSLSKLRNSSITKEDYRQKRKEERQRILEDIERREREPPKQFSLINIKTAVTRYPTINYVSPFSNEEIYEGKRCYINGWRRTPQAELIRQGVIERTASPKKKLNMSTTKITINLHSTNDETLLQNSTIPFDAAPEIKPRPRALGGVWITASDIPHAFTNLIIYHNLTAFKKTEVLHDVWQDQHQPFVANEKDVYIKLTLDDELFTQFKTEHKLDPSLTLAQIMAPPSNAQKAKESWDEVSDLLPGQRRKNRPNPNQIFVAFAPYPTSKPYEIMPRYFSRLQQVNGETNLIDFSLTKYFEATNCQFPLGQCTQQTIWLKPLINAPLGYSLFLGSNLRSIEVVSRQDYLTSQHGFVSKQYTADFLPQTAGRMNVFAKYEFKIPDAETRFNLKVGCSDKYLANFMRLKIVDKSASPNQAIDHLTFNNMDLQNVVLPKTEQGYILVIEGNMPYNTSEGQITIDVHASHELLLEEILSTEPIEWTDSYKPWKYGIIFKEKVAFHSNDNIMSSFNLRLLKNGKEWQSRKPFTFEILDNNKVIYAKKAWNQMNLSHFLFRASQGLPETSDNPDQELKHNYVLQATFDLHQWPEAKSLCEETEGISWVLKFFTSDTIALIKDTDKEDREKALKLGWETAEPGRAEKAAKSRQRYLLQQKQKAGEELTDEELAILSEKRERVRKKDLEEAVNVKGTKKAAPPAKADAKKGGKAVEEKKHTPVLIVHEEEPAVVLPEPSQHVNANIVAFLEHFKAERLIQISKKDSTRQRSEEEKKQMVLDRQAQREIERQQQQQALAERESDKELRDRQKKDAIKGVQEERQAYKERLAETMGERNQYRDKILMRNEKMRMLSDILAMDKIDINQLQTAVDQAIENKVKKEVIERGQKQLAWLRYCKDVEALLAQAVAEKVKENILQVLERIDREGVVMEPKVLQDAKNVAAKLK